MAAFWRSPPVPELIAKDNKGSILRVRLRSAGRVGIGCWGRPEQTEDRAARLGCRNGSTLRIKLALVGDGAEAQGLGDRCEGLTDYPCAVSPIAITLVASISVEAPRKLAASILSANSRFPFARCTYLENDRS